MDFDKEGEIVSRQSEEAQPQGSHQLIGMSPSIHGSDRTKKPCTGWNEEGGFLPQPLRSLKKKILEDPRECTTSLNFSILYYWSIARLLNYSNTCGVKFLGSPNQKSKCFEMIKILEVERATKSSHLASTFVIPINQTLNTS